MIGRCHMGDTIKFKWKTRISTNIAYIIQNSTKKKQKNFNLHQESYIYQLHNHTDKKYSLIRYICLIIRYIDRKRERARKKRNKCGKSFEICTMIIHHFDSIGDRLHVKHKKKTMHRNFLVRFWVSFSFTWQFRPNKLWLEHWNWRSSLTNAFACSASVLGIFEWCRWFSDMTIP